MGILTSNEVADALRYASVDDVPQAAFNDAAAVDAHLKEATGWDWGSDLNVHPLAKKAGSLLLQMWFDDRGKDGEYGITNLIIGLKNIATANKEALAND